MFSPIVPVNSLSDSASVPASPNFAWQQRRAFGVRDDAVGRLVGEQRGGDLRSAVWPKTSLRATKSVSQLSSTSAPILPSWLDVARDDAFLRRCTAGALLGLGDALLAQALDGLLHVAVVFLERLLAIHHAGAGALAQLGHILGGVVQPLLAIRLSVVETPPGVPAAYES